MKLRTLSFLLALIPSFAIAAVYSPDGDLIGEPTYYTVKKNDNLSAIARKFDVGIVELLSANPGVTSKNLRFDSKLLIPTMHVLPEEREGIVLNLPELRLFYFMPDGRVMTVPMGIGRDGWETPVGETAITLKRKDPTWVVPDSIRAEEPKLPAVVPPGPDNPLGLFALNLGIPGYRIHGTNHPYSIGKRASHGCVRLYPEDIETLFGNVEVGIPVAITDRPYKLGWRDDELWMELGPTQEQDDDIAAYRTVKPAELMGLYNEVEEFAGDEAEVDWDKVDDMARRHSGIPAVIGRRKHL